MTRSSEHRIALHASARASGLGLTAAVALSLLGCPNPNSYGTPRTIAPGKLQHTVAVEAFHVRGTPSSGRESYTLPAAPTYQLRLGAADRVDIGFRVPNLSSLGADVKWNFLRGNVDAAIVPGVQGVLFGKIGGLVYLHGGVPIGFNFSESATFVLTPGLSYGFTALNGVPTGRDALVGVSGALLRLSAGLALRLGSHDKPKFTIFPEVTVMRALHSVETLMFIPGIGFQFGAAPDYRDQIAPEDRPPPPPPPRPGHNAPPAPGPGSRPPRPAPTHTAPTAPTPAPTAPAPAPSPNPLPPPPPPGPK